MTRTSCRWIRSVGTVGRVLTAVAGTTVRTLRIGSGIGIASCEPGLSRARVRRP